MCGILACFNKKKPVNDDIINQYEEQNGRGTEGFGIILINQNKKIEIKRATEPTKFLLDLYNYPANGIIAHHRTPTSTDNKLQQTHPIKVSNKLLKYDYYVIHNGIIRNSWEMVEKHNKLGFKYTTETQGRYINTTLTQNDSECLAIELALYLEKLSTIIEAKGGAAFVCLKVDKKSQKAISLYFGKNESSPLNYHIEDKYIMISSEGKGEILKDKTMFEINLNTEKYNPKKISIKFKEEEPITSIIPFNKGNTITDYTNTNHLLNSHKNKFQSRIPIGFRDDSPEENYPQKNIYDWNKQHDWNNQQTDNFKGITPKGWMADLIIGDKTDIKETFKDLKSETIADLETLISDLKNLNNEWFDVEDLKYYTEQFNNRLKDCVKTVMDTYSTQITNSYESQKVQQIQDAISI